MLEFLHELAAAVWLGGLITLGALVPALRRAGAERPLLRAAARRFGHLSWVAMGVLVITGLARYWPARIAYDSDGLFLGKAAMVVGVVALAAVHQVTARHSTPRTRGVIQGLTLVVGVGIFGAATAL